MGSNCCVSKRNNQCQTINSKFECLIQGKDGKSRSDKIKSSEFKLQIEDLSKRERSMTNNGAISERINKGKVEGESWRKRVQQRKTFKEDFLCDESAIIERNSSLLDMSPL